MNKNLIKAIKEDFSLVLGVYFMSIVEVGDKSRYHLFIRVNIHKDQEPDVLVSSYFGDDLLSSSALYFTDEYEQFASIAKKIKNQMPSFTTLMNRKKLKDTLKLSDVL